MNLRQWRESKGYSLLEVAVMLDRKSPATIYEWEKRGIKLNRIRMELKRISLGAITHFKGMENEQ